MKAQTAMLAALSLAALAACNRPAGPPAVATIDGEDRVELNEDIVKRTFVDGGQIDIIGLQRIQGEIHLVRMGRDIGGGTQTEAVPLVRSGGNMFPPTGPVKIKLCLSSICTSEEVEGSDSCGERGDGQDAAVDIGEILGELLDSITITVGPANVCHMLPDGSSCTCSLTGTSCVWGTPPELELHDLVFWRG